MSDFLDSRKALRRRAAWAANGTTASLETLVELNGLRDDRAAQLRDLADVIELVRVNALLQELAESLHPYVRQRSVELWQAAQASDD